MSIALLLALQDTVVEALPQDVAAAAAQTASVAHNSSINYVDLILRASIPVKIIVLLLLIGSFISWVIIFRKARAFKQANREGGRVRKPLLVRCGSGQAVRLGNRSQPYRRWSGVDVRKRLPRVLPVARPSPSGCTRAVGRRAARHAHRLHPAKSISLSAISNCWPTSAPPRRTSAWLVPCSASW